MHTYEHTEYKTLIVFNIQELQLFDIYTITRKNFVFDVGEYDWHPGLRKNSSGKRNYPALKCSTFIKTLCETFDNVQKEEASSQERIDINEIILRTNLKLVKFIDNKMNWDLQDESWSSGPRLPIVTDQFCKQLKFPPKKQKNEDKPNDE